MHLDCAVPGMLGVVAREPVVEARELSLNRGDRRVLAEVSMRVGTGVTVVLGPNGSGKSTLLRALATLDPVASGSLQILGLEVGRSTLSRVRRHVGYMAQAPEFLPRMTVRENLWYAGWLNRVPKTERSSRLDELVDALRLGDVGDRQARALSDGTRQRLGLAMASLNSPALLLLDEPTAGVDTEHRARFRGFIRRMGEDRAVVVASHLHEDVMGLADRAVVVGHGRVLFDDSATALLALAADASTDELPTEAALRQLLER